MAIRATSFWAYACHADPALFLSWDDVPVALKEDCEQHGGIPCDGGGVPGPWCADCRFGTQEEYLVRYAASIREVDDGRTHRA